MNRYFYIAYVAQRKTLGSNQLIIYKEIFSNICLRIPDGKYLNHKIALKTITEMNQHYNPVILNIIEMTEEQFSQFSDDQKFKEISIKE